MADGATIDPLSIHVIAGGHRVSGFAPDSWLSVVYDVEAFARSIGVDGEGAWFKNANRAAGITLQLMQTSQSNDILSGLHLADLNTPNGLLFGLTIEEKNGTTIYATDKARVVKLPDGIWGSSPQTRTWLLGTTQLEGFVGGILAAGG